MVTNEPIPKNHPANYPQNNPISGLQNAYRHVAQNYRTQQPPAGNLGATNSNYGTPTQINNDAELNSQISQGTANFNRTYYTNRMHNYGPQTIQQMATPQNYENLPTHYGFNSGPAQQTRGSESVEASSNSNPLHSSYGVPIIHGYTNVPPSRSVGYQNIQVHNPEPGFQGTVNPGNKAHPFHPVYKTIE